MLILGIALGLILGLLAGGRIENLASVRLRWIGAVPRRGAPRFGTESCSTRRRRSRDVPAAAVGGRLRDAARRLWANRVYPGIASRSSASYERDRHHRQRRLHADLGAEPRRRRLHPGRRAAAIHGPAGPALDANFLLHLGPLGDIIPIPLPIIQNVASIGDIFLSVGLAFFLFAVSSGRPQELDEERARGHPRATGRRRRPPLAAAPATRARRRACRRPSPTRPRWSGRRPRQRRARPGLAVARDASSRCPARDAGGATRSRPAALVETSSASASTRTSASRSTAPSRRSGPASSSRCSATGSTSSRSSLVLAISTGSPLAAGLVFLAATLPNLFLARSPARSSTAGTRRRSWSSATSCARRWSCSCPSRGHEHRARLSAGLPGHVDLGLLPAGADRDPAADRRRGRPADRELGPVDRRHDRRRHRLPARRALRGVLGSALPLAFWFDGATYLASAVLIATMWSLPPAARPGEADDGRLADPAAVLGPPRCAAAGTSCATRPCCSQTPCRARSASSRSALVRPDATSSRRRSASRASAAAAYAFIETGIRPRQPDRRLRHRPDRGALGQGPDGHRRLRDLGAATVLLALIATSASRSD